MQCDAVINEGHSIREVLYAISGMIGMRGGAAAGFGKDVTVYVAAGVVQERAAEALVREFPRCAMFERGGGRHET